jgi:hypothetical protein
VFATSLGTSITAELAEANTKAEAEVDKLVAADAAKYGPNWEARKKQAADLLEKSRESNAD